MPSISEFMAGFGAGELILTLFILACVVVGREQGRIFKKRSR